MNLCNLADRTFKTAMLMLSLSVLTGCWPIKPEPPVVLPESQVQKMSKGDSANFDGYLMTTGATVKLLEKAERCGSK